MMGVIYPALRVESFLERSTSQRMRVRWHLSNPCILWVCTTFYKVVMMLGSSGLPQLLARCHQGHISPLRNISALLFVFCEKSLQFCVSALYFSQSHISSNPCSALRSQRDCQPMLPSVLFLSDECVIFHHSSLRVSSCVMYLYSRVYNPSNLEVTFKIICHEIENIRILKNRY